MSGFRETARAVRRSAASVMVLSTLFLLGGCGWFGDSEKPPLPGERVSALQLNRQLNVDPELAGTDVILPEPYVNNAWAQAGGNQTHAMYHLKANSGALQQVWSVDIGASASSDNRLLAEPIVADGVVYAMDANSIVSALDAASGRQIWRKDLTPDDEDDDLFGGGIAWSEAGVVISTPFARVFLLDAKTGEVKWEATAPAPMRSAPAVSDGRVFVITIDNQLLVYALDDGRKLWSNAGVEEAAGLLGGTTPAVDGDIVIAAYTSGELLAFDVTDGRSIWTESLAGGARGNAIATLTDIRGRPVIDRDFVVAIGNGGVMAAIDKERGGRVWDNGLGGTQMPWVAGDFVFVLTNDSEVVCLSRQDGRIKWITALPQFENPQEKEDRIYWSGPVLVSDRLLVTGSSGMAVALSPYDGSIIGKQTLPDSSHLPPVVANETIYILSDDARLIALK
ncbi:PQQ-like beta-propeller repeat protein [Dongia deserti]|uniref:PQQ-like beta-propeller repeat protein n=1 Tax=Dongia deserti TaxID=2268030 RepID=UPI000E648AC3|nr:PQQ-like beta-propeller repeat protein [Dongia deserti]